MKIFISGGCKNGKTSLGEDLCVKMSGDRPRYYIATMIPYDSEDDLRIERHKQSRAGKGFETVECPLNIMHVLDLCEPDCTFILDSVTALLTNEMYRPENNWATDEEAPERVASQLKEFCGKVKNAVFVSDYIYSADEDYSEFTEQYRKGLALCDRVVAQSCDMVIDMCAAIPQIIKGGPLE